MTEHNQALQTSRERFLEAAQKELAAFERKESEFRKQVRKERAVQLNLPAVQHALVTSLSNYGL
jgi:hypothetical protein